MARKRTTTRARRGTGCVQRRERKKKDGTITVFYEGRIDIGYSADGKRRQKSVTSKSKDEVERMLRELADSPKKGEPAKPNDQDKITVAAFVDSWIAHAVRPVPSTLKHYSDQTRRYINPFFGSVLIKDLTEDQLREWVLKLQDPKYAIRKPLSDKTVKDVFSFFKSVLQSAVRKGILDKNPCDFVQLRKPAEYESPKLNEAEVQRLLVELRGKAHERYFLLLIFMGVREEEALGLTISDIDFDNRVIHVRYQLRKNLEEKILVGETKHFKLLKDHEQRDLCFDEEMASLLKAQIAEEFEKKKQLGDAWPVRELERGDLLFSNKDGYYLSYRTIFDCFKRRVKKIGRPEVRVHDMRHVYAMLAGRGGDTIKAVAKHLGHATPDFTFRVYDYVSDEAKRDSAKKMSAVMATFTRSNEQSA